MIHQRVHIDLVIGDAAKDSDNSEKIGGKANLSLLLTLAEASFDLRP
jgi:hypothetical protein